MLSSALASITLEPMCKGVRNLSLWMQPSHPSGFCLKNSEQVYRLSGVRLSHLALVSSSEYSLYPLEIVCARSREPSLHAFSIERTPA